MLGKPVVKGTRLTIEKVLSLLAQGMSQEELISNYPQLTSESVKAIFAYMAERLRSEEDYFNQAS
jgi:uncharacterized protein (DUF433 family)